MERPAGLPLLLGSFERHLRAANRADTTVTTYLIGARQAEAFLRARGTELPQASRADLEAFLGDLLARRSPSTAATYHKVLRILYAWLEEEGEITASPMAKLRPPIIPEPPVPVVPKDGLRRLLATCLMAADNHTSIVGNLAADPELRFTNTGTPVANLRVAVTQRIQDKDGTWRDGETSFHKVNVWRDQAHNLTDSLAKGDRVMVTGRLRQRAWETPEGERRSVTEIDADEVGASLRFHTAKLERAHHRATERATGREAERVQFNDEPPTY
jgi:single-strand DNA-binding protein